jgi:hypothetical protein
LLLRKQSASAFKRGSERPVGGRVHERVHNHEIAAAVEQIWRAGQEMTFLTISMPVSHRGGVLPELRDAQDQVMLASHLLRIVDVRRPS